MKTGRSEYNYEINIFPQNYVIDLKTQQINIFRQFIKKNSETTILKLSMFKRKNKNNSIFTKIKVLIVCCTL